MRGALHTRFQNKWPQDPVLQERYKEEVYDLARGGVQLEEKFNLVQIKLDRIKDDYDVPPDSDVAIALNRLISSWGGMRAVRHLVTHILDSQAMLLI